MLVATPSQTSQFYNSHRQQHTQQTSGLQQYYPNSLDIDLDIDADSSISSSPHSTQSLVPQLELVQGAPLSGLDSTPLVSAPRGAQPEALFSTRLAFDDSPALTAADLMHSDSWLASNGQFISKPAGRAAHHREPSLSSLGSAGPASPYSQNTSNPQIAVTDSVGDGFHSLPYYDDSSYQLAKSLSPANNDSLYTSHVEYSPDATSASAYSRLLAAHRQRSDRGLLPPPDLSTSSNRSRPVSVASSVASDSPATPSLEQPDDDGRQRTTFATIPKLDRTMTDIYSDELYSPSFTITSAAPSQTSQIPLSPNHDMFAQRLQAINSQHLSAAHSPLSSTSRDKSPFRQGSPLAPSAGRDFGAGMSPSRLRFSSAQHLREQRKAEQDAQLVRQQMARNTDPGTPQTISPKDAILEFNEPEGEANFPLFPAQDTAGFDASQAVAQANSTFDSLPMDGSNFNYIASQLPAGIPIPQQYPFVAHARQKSDGSSMSVPSRMSSAGSSASDSAGDTKQVARPPGATADGGTYTCTYHGCSLRFETPALLQKHKREGHRQAHGLNGTRRSEAAVTPGLYNTQAGPHRCDRINPSTGKPCNTIFSRPYDLTRHEDTIHNARKQKVRCSLCTEEKTFSRADALTRHFRVCHPDVEFPGKHRRRGVQGA